MRLLRRLLFWLRFRSHNADLVDEVALHRDVLERHLIARGVAPADTRAPALRTMGNDTAMREEARGLALVVRRDSGARRHLRAAQPSPRSRVSARSAGFGRCRDGPARCGAVRELPSGAVCGGRRSEDCLAGGLTHSEAVI